MRSFALYPLCFEISLGILTSIHKELIRHHVHMECKACTLVKDAPGVQNAHVILGSGLTMISEYENYLSRLPISNHTKRNYAQRVRRFLSWLEDCPDTHTALAGA